MQCAICSRPPSYKLPFHCPGCARHSLYELRAESAKALLRRETLSREVESVCSNCEHHEVKQENPSRKTLANYRPSRWDTHQLLSTAKGIDGRCREIKAQAEILREEIEKARVEIRKLKSSLETRRADFASVTHNVGARRKSTLESIEKSIRRMVYRGDQQHQRTAESRIFLCREAAKLYGLRQRRRRGNASREEYLIGGVGIVDLKDLTNAAPAQITTSLTHLAQLLVLVSHYLSLQLPAEITLPHRDYPLPTIFPPSSSYTLRPVPFPGSAISSQSSPPSSRAADTRSLPRPRPLFLDKPLPQLAKDDSVAYSLFIEGVTLLAWDIAWVCRTQGINIGAQSWDEVCALGKNLWQLLVSPPPRLLQPIRKSSHGRDSSPHDTTQDPSISPAPASAVSTTHPLSILGHYSHGTAHSFLGAAEGTEFMRGWKLQGPMKIVDRLRSLLLGELTGAEWEVLDQDEWGPEAAGHDASETTVLVGGGTTTTNNKSNNNDDHKTAIENDIRIHDAGSDLDRGSQPERHADTGALEGYNLARERSAGTSGWTKLRPRP